MCELGTTWVKATAQLGNELQLSWVYEKGLSKNSIRATAQLGCELQRSLMPVPELTTGLAQCSEFVRPGRGIQGDKKRNAEAEKEKHTKKHPSSQGSSGSVPFSPAERPLISCPRRAVSPDKPGF